LILVQINYRGSMKTTRIITKYANRRLYDSEESRYVTLIDIRRLVKDKIDFIVWDRKSGIDITRTILLQVITDLERTGHSIMSRKFLSQVIRSYDKVVPEFVTEYLEESMRFFMTQQKNLLKQINRVMDRDPFKEVAGIAQDNFVRWKSLQEEVLQRLGQLAVPEK